jgi:hypothetical protein
VVINLAGTLEGIGLAALVRFLVSLNPSGRLLVADDVWGGEVGFDEGRVVTAAFGAERGLGALEAIALALPNGEFRFTGGAAPEARDVELPPEELERYLTSLAEEQTAMAKVLPSLASVPRLVDPAGATAGGPDRITIDRSTLYSLLLVDGQRTVHAICEQRGERGAAQTLKELSWLAGTGMVRIASPAGGAFEDATPSIVPPAAPPAAAVPGPASVPPPAAPEPALEAAAAPEAEAAPDGDEAPGEGTPEPESPPASGARLGAVRLTRGAEDGGGPPAPRASAFSAGPGSGAMLSLAGAPGLVASGDLAVSGEEDAEDETALRYWRRTLVLTLLALTLLALSWWQQTHWSAGPLP